LSGRFDPDVPFGLLGIDSLGTIEMAAALEQTLGHALPPELLLECQDGRMLAARIRQFRENLQLADLEDPFDQMLADAVLPEDVRPPQRGEANTDLRRARRILLTGSTGFLGSALLRELLESTEAEIVCLVRDPAATRASRSIPCDFRLQAEMADLSRPQLGLSQASFDALATEVDAVVHCGASVNWIYSYSALRATNVLGTVELLRLACRRGIPFHFISSLSVCYSTGGPRTADETFDALRYIRGIQLGYAQTKAVGESLVREAAERGLPARIYRPPLISGASHTGAYNRDDLITALVRGCVHMGTAPDLDWKLDCQPVDFVAKAIIALSAGRGPVYHIGHERPRHWRECALWMRLYGYSIRLVPYHTWLRQLDCETRPLSAGSQDHPLRALRTFFLDRPAGSRGLTLPELYEESRRTRAEGNATRNHLAAAGMASPTLDAALLETYFCAMRQRGDLPSPQTPSLQIRSVRAFANHRHAPFTREFLTRLLNRRVADFRVTSSGSDHSIVSELAAWRSRKPTGLFRVSVRFVDGSERLVRLKVKASDADVIAVGEALAALIDPRIGDAYARWSGRIGFSESHRREIEIYRQGDSRFTRHAPALLGSLMDEAAGCWAMALEEVEDATLMDTADDPSGWSPAHINRAISGLAALHSIWYSREAELQAKPWIGYVQSTRGMTGMRDLWSALAHHAAPSFSSWAHPDIGAIHRRLIDTIPHWWSWMEHGPLTLIHHDFNPRNVFLRVGELNALDWELATIGAPQRDLAEFLCFVLPADVDAASVHRWIERHRASLERESSTPIDSAAWEKGFRAGLYDCLVNRLSIYMVVHRVRHQAFLPRVVRTWHRLYEIFPLQEHA
jgi:thioester reductase-like protein